MAKNQRLRAQTERQQEEIEHLRVMIEQYDKLYAHMNTLLYHTEKMLGVAIGLSDRDADPNGGEHG